MKQTKLLIIALLLLAINSCKKEEKVLSGSYRDYTPKATQEEYGSARVVGFVVDKAGNPLDGVRVHFGEHESITDGEGKFELSEVSVGSGKRIWFEKEGYARTQKLIDAREDLPNRVDAALFQIAESEKINDDGGLIEGEDFSVDIQPGGFVYADGEIVEGEVIVSVTPFLTSEENFIDAFPGDFEGRREDGSTTPIESFGFIDVDLRDEFGEPVQMANGVTAIIKIKAPENAPATIPMWWYDFKKAEWIEEGSGSLDNGFYTAKVTHFTPWNWDIPRELRSTIIGRVVDNEGYPIEGASVSQKGLNRNIFLDTKSRYDGTFEMFTLENLELELEAQFDIYGSTILEKTTSSNQTEINDLGDITIDIRIGNIVPPIVNNDTLYITAGQRAIISGNYLGEEKRENYRLLLNNEEIPTLNWQNKIIEFEVPIDLPEEGTIQIDRDGNLSKVIPYIENDWTCEIGGFVYDNNDLPFSKYHFNIDIVDKSLESLPDCIGNLNNLQNLHLGDNHLIKLPESISKINSLLGLYLNDNQLIRLPESIGNLNNLIEFELSANQLSSLPESIGDLSYLRNLWVNSNNLISLPETIGNLNSLIQLSLKDNQISNLPESIGNLTNLGELVVENNQLKSLPESIGSLTNLLTLNLHLNNLESIPETIVKLSNLEVLYLSKNKLSELPVLIGNLSSLSVLSLHHNQLNILPESIGNLTNLNLLIIESNNITKLPKSIGRMSSLGGLYLQNNQLSNLPESIGNLNRLNIFNLENNELSALPESIGNLSKLGELNLSNNKLTTLPETIKNLSNNLYSLNLAGNPITESEKAKTEEWLPNTTIIW